MNDYSQVGGKARPEWEPAFTSCHGSTPAVNDPPIVDFGWIPPFVRTPEMWEAHEEASQLLVPFSIRGTGGQDDAKKVWLFELWKHPEVVAALGFPYPGTHQLTGSCVGAGGGNVHFTLAAIEVIRLRDPEQIIIPFWPLTYGRSRFHAGMRGRGEGSFGAAYAKAALQDGILPNNVEGLPKPTNSDALVWGANVEMEWSAGDRAPATNWLEKSRIHLVKSAAQLRSADEVRQAIVNGYPVTCASMYGHNPKVVGEGADAVLMGIKGPRWAHQMSIQGWWEHPKHGEIFWLHNQWGLGAHGTDPAGGPKGGVWIKNPDMDWICQDEVFAFSQFQGFPASTLTWNY